MRPTVLPALLLLLAHSAVATARAESVDPTEIDDGLHPPGSAGDLARDHGVPAVGEGPIPYVIVTSRALRPAFLELGRERIRRGVASAVRSVESLRSDYPVAIDDADRVRRFLRDAHDRWSTRWVLLGGDVGEVPPRFATMRGVLGERQIVSDWYYACLDGTWDGDGDGLYGELSDPSGPGDAPDLEAELYVGRAPVSDKAEARRFVDKTLGYQDRPADGFENRTLLFAHRLTPFFDLAGAAEQVLPRIADDPAQEVIRLYESWDDPSWAPVVFPETRQSVIDAFNHGKNVAIGFGAGSPEVLAVGEQFVPEPQLLTVADVLGLTNGDRAGHLWLLTSLVNAFDQPTSIGEAFLRAPNGGAVTVIAPSDLTFVLQSQQLISRLVDVVFDEGVASIGEALVNARAVLVGLVGQEVVLSYQLLGDPLLRVFHASPVAAARGPDHGRTGISSRTRPREETGVSDRLLVIAAASTPDARVGERPRPVALALSRPTPSPSRTSMRVECAIPDGAAVAAEVVDLAGRSVRALAPGAARGATALTWDLRDRAGRRVLPGVYFLRVRAGVETRTARVLVTDP